MVNEMIESASISERVGSPTMINAGIKIKRMVAMLSPMAKARSIHSLCNVICLARA